MRILSLAIALSLPLAGCASIRELPPWASGPGSVFDDGRNGTAE